MRSRKYQYYYFILAKIVGLAVKPLFLYYFIQNEMVGEASTLSLVFLFLAGVFVILSVPVHFDFYKQYFEANSNMASSRKVLASYIDALLSHILLVIPVIFIITIISFESLLLSILMFFLLLSEKVFDEIQRFLMFSKQFVFWSNAFLLKSLVPIVFAFFVAELFAFDLIEAFMLATIVLNFFIGLIFIPKFIYLYFASFFASMKHHFVCYVKTFKSKLMSKYFSGLTHANVLNADKWVVTILNVKSLLSELMLVAQFSNTITIASNYAFIANRRSELLKKDNSLDSLWYGYKVPGVTLIFGLALGLAFSIGLYWGALDLKNLPLMSVILIVAAYTVYAITEPVTEYIFWNGGVKALVIIDVFYFLAVVFFGIGLFYFDAIEYVSLGFFVAMLFRLFIQLILLQKLVAD